MIKARRCGGSSTEIENYFNDLLQRGVVIRGSADVCASPITCVQKWEQYLRVCDNHHYRYSVEVNGVDVLSTKTKAIREYPMRKELRRFLGMVNYYNRFLFN